MTGRAIAVFSVRRCALVLVVICAEPRLGERDRLAEEWILFSKYQGIPLNVQLFFPAKND